MSIDIEKSINSIKLSEFNTTKVNAEYKFTIGKNDVAVNLDKNTVIYGLNGTGKTRLLNTLYGINNNKNFLVELSESGVESTEKIKNYEIIKENKDLLNECLNCFEDLEVFDFRTRKEIKVLKSYVNDDARNYDPQALQYRITRLGNRILKHLDYLDNEIYNINQMEYTKKLLHLVKKIELKNVNFERKANVYYLPTTRGKDSIDKLLNEYIHSELVVDGEKSNYSIFDEIKILEEKCKLLNQALKPYLDIKVSIDMLNKEFILNDRLTFEALSSGEKNIVIIFATVIFLPDKSVLLIDEPEISFSINYQNSFITDILTANPCLKYIIATHSPFIFKDATTEHFSVIELKVGN